MHPMREAEIFRHILKSADKLNLGSNQSVPLDALFANLDPAAAITRTEFDQVVAISIKNGNMKAAQGTEVQVTDSGWETSRGL